MRPANLTLIPLLIMLALAACSSDPVAPRQASPPEPGPPEPLEMLALGDSYTLGQSIPQDWSWPHQLADSLASQGDTLKTLVVEAQTGWTTEDLLRALETDEYTQTPRENPFELVTLMIGVNNLFQDLDPQIFETQLDTLIQLALAQAGGDNSRVLGFSIPDYSVTPVGSLFDPEGIAADLLFHNGILQEKYQAAGIIMLDVTDLSQAAADDATLIARDNLHFSAPMYGRWVQMMLPAVRTALVLD